MVAYDGISGLISLAPLLRNLYIDLFKAQEVMRSRRTLHVSDVLSRLFRQPKFRQGIRAAQIKLRWAEIVGPEIAARAQPVRLSHGRLEVHCDHDVWRTELQYLKPELLKRIAEVEGDGVVKEIFLK